MVCASHILSTLVLQCLALLCEPFEWQNSKKLGKIKVWKNWFPTPPWRGNGIKTTCNISLPLLRIQFSFGGGEEGYRMRIKIRSFVVPEEEGHVYRAAGRCVLRVFYCRCGSVSGFWQSPRESVHHISLFFKKHYIILSSLYIIRRGGKEDSWREKKRYAGSHKKWEEGNMTGWNLQAIYKLYLENNRNFIRTKLHGTWTQKLINPHQPHKKIAKRQKRVCIYLHSQVMGFS